MAMVVTAGNNAATRIPSPSLRRRPRQRHEDEHRRRLRNPRHLHRRRREKRLRKSKRLQDKRLEFEFSTISRRRSSRSSPASSRAGTGRLQRPRRGRRSLPGWSSSPTNLLPLPQRVRQHKQHLVVPQQKKKRYQQMKQEQEQLDPEETTATSAIVTGGRSAISSCSAAPCRPIPLPPLEVLLLVALVLLAVVPAPPLGSNFPGRSSRSWPARPRGGGRDSRPTTAPMVVLRIAGTSACRRDSCSSTSSSRRSIAS